MNMKNAGLWLEDINKDKYENTRTPLTTIGQRLIENTKVDGRLLADFWITLVKSGFYTVRLVPRPSQNMFRVDPRETLGRIIHSILIQKSEKQWKVLRVFLKNLPTGGPLGNQTYLLGCAPQESLITLRTP